MEGSSTDISVVIAVYNSRDYLPRCIDSILNQTIDHKRLEIILVDDGSTDGVEKICDEYASSHPDLIKVFHQENSGGPATPRNRGIREARGEYIFFCDHDDYFGEEALERMIKHANEWNSDVMLVKLGESNRKSIPRKVFKETVPSADVYTSNVVSSLGPWKLFRRSLLINNGIFFPTDVSPDDHYFVLKAYLLAQVISIAADYDYYFLMIREDGQNLIHTGPEKSVWHKTEARIKGIALALDVVEEYADPNKSYPMYKKLFEEGGLYALVALRKEDAKKGKELFRLAQELYSPHINQMFIKKSPFNIAATYTCLIEGPGYDYFVADSNNKGKQFESYEKFDDIYYCSRAVQNGYRCSACDATVKSEHARQNKKKKKDFKKKYFSGRAGHIAMRFSNLPGIRKIKSVVVKRMLG